MTRNVWKLSSALALGVIALLGVIHIMIMGVAAQAAMSSQPMLAYDLRPQNSKSTADMAAAAFVAGDMKGAERLAKEAIGDSPIEVSAIRTLGQVRGARGARSGEALMLLAASLSWRDMPTQFWTLQRAVIAGSAKVAVERGEAIVRMQVERELAYILLRTLAMSPDGRAHLVRKLAEKPFWRRDFLSPSNAIPADQVEPLAQILRDLGDTNAPPDRVEARFAIDVLADAGRYHDAFALYSKLFPSAKASALLRDGGFEEAGAGLAGGAANQFDWRIYSRSGGDAAIESVTDGRGHYLYTLSASAEHTDLVGQVLVLDAGAYELSFAFQGEHSAAGQQVVWQIRCLGAGGAVLLEPTGALSPPGEWHRRVRRFVVPANCPAQILQLQSFPAADGSEHIARIDDVQIARR